MTTRQVRTVDLQFGDVVALPGGIFRTVLEVKPSGMFNRHNKIIFNVTYIEGDTPDWSGGNSGLGDSLWTVVGHEEPERMPEITAAQANAEIRAARRDSNQQPFRHRRRQHH